MQSSAPESAAAAATFLFADIAGFTALTEAHGDEEAADLVVEFCDAVKAELPTYGGAHVKTIGDALLVRVPDPGPAVLLALRISNDLLRGHGAPAVRVGLHHGPAVERDGDYFGATVNLAARVSAVATAGEVLVTGQTAGLVPDLEGVFCSTTSSPRFALASGSAGAATRPRGRPTPSACPPSMSTRRGG
jgi:class 3 adenylate cyclase